MYWGHRHHKRWKNLANQLALTDFNIYIQISNPVCSGLHQILSPCVSLQPNVAYTYANMFHMMIISESVQMNLMKNIPIRRKQHQK